MSDVKFPATLKPIVNKGYSYERGSNIWRTEVQGGPDRQGRDTFFEPVPFSITLIASSLGNQVFQMFLNNIDGGASSFEMMLDSGFGVELHQCLIASTIGISTNDQKNWTITFTVKAERTRIQENDCLSQNLPGLYACYGDGLHKFLLEYNEYQSTYPRIWDPMQ